MALSLTRRLELWTRGLVAVLTTVGLAVIWTTFLASTLGERDASAKVEGARLERSAAAFAVGLRHVLGDARLALSLLQRQVASHPNEDPEHSAEFLALVQVVRDRSQGLVDLRGVNSEGYRVVFGMPPDQPPINLADRPYYRLQVPYPGVGFYIDAPVVSRASGLWTLILSDSVPSHGGSLAVLYVALEFPRLDAMVSALSDTDSETVTVYRADGTPLYRHPLPDTFPLFAGRKVTDEIATTGLESGLLGGAELRAFRKVDDVPAWVVVSRPAANVAEEWEKGFGGQLVWVSLLTLAILGSSVGLLWLLGQLRAIRMNQENLARIDSLTGLLNRRAFLERCDLERSRAQRSNAPLGMLLLDLDHFKQVNDRFGHQEGDRVLKDFAAALRRTLRTTDGIARIGGEEFAVLLPSTDRTASLDTAERVRAEVSTIALPQGNLTSSLGLAMWDGMEAFDNWYQRADQALYRAKSGGRNRVETAF